MVSANYEAYKSVMKQAYRDGEITPEESAILETLRQSLNISTDEHSKIETEVQDEIKNGGGPNNISDNLAPPNPGEPQGGGDDYNIIRPGANNNPGELGGPEGGNPGGDIAAETPPVDMGAPAEEEEEPQSLDELLKAGKSSYHEGNFQMAITYFDKALQQDAENSEALFFRKRSFSKLSESGGAVGGSAAEVINPGAGSMPPEPGGGAAAIEPGGAAVQVPTGGGDPNCSSCNGSGTCRWCKATGGCYWCKGSGQCDKCKGTGVLKGQQCSACAGSGKCHSCKGTGKCYWCQGDGRCSKCMT